MTGTICQNCTHLNVCKYTSKMALVESKCEEVFKGHDAYSIFTHDDDIVLGYPLKVILSCECFLCKADEEDEK